MHVLSVSGDLGVFMNPALRMVQTIEGDHFGVGCKISELLIQNVKRFEHLLYYPAALLFINFLFVEESVFLLFDIVIQSRKGSTQIFFCVNGTVVDADYIVVI